MRDEDFEKRMDDWASHELEAAPRLRPKPEMYRMIKAGKGKVLPPVTLRRVLVGLAAACLAAVVLIISPLFQPTGPGERPSIGLREGFTAKRGVTIKPPPKRGGKGPGRGVKGPKKGPVAFHRLQFHYQEAGSPSVYGFDIRFPTGEEVTLGPEDNYRFVLQPAEDRFVYMFQLDSLGKLVKLLPNESYAPYRNPLEKGQTYHLPPEPNWLYPGRGKGEETIYVVASAEPLPELESLYEAYLEAEGKRAREESLSPLFDRIRSTGKAPGEEAAHWIVTFHNQ